MGAYEFKKRTRLGRWIDRNGISQDWLIRNIPLNKTTVNLLCNNMEHEPIESTQIKIISGLRKNGHDVRAGDFW